MFSVRASFSRLVKPTGLTSVAVILGAIGLAASPAAAASVTYEVHGTVVQGISNGTSVLTTSPIFNPLIGQEFVIIATADTVVDQTFAVGFNPPGPNDFEYFSDFSFSVGGFSGGRAQAGFSDKITVQNDVPPFIGVPTDAFGGTFGGGTFASFTSNPAFGTFSTASISFGLLDTAGTAFGSGALPLSLNLADFEFGTMSLFLNPPAGGVVFIRAGINSVIVSQSQSAAVPEPSSLLLVGSGILAAVRRCRRNKRVSGAI